MKNNKFYYNYGWLDKACDNDFRVIPGIVFMGLFALLGLAYLGQGIHDKQKEHDYKLKNDPNYAQAYYDKEYPFNMYETKKGVALRWKGIKGLDIDKDGIVDEAHKWIGGGRCGIGKIKYDPNDFQYKKLQQRYSRALKEEKKKP